VWHASLVLFVWLIAANTQDRSQLDITPEANRTIAGAYHEWVQGDIKPPPVICLYGQRTGTTSASLTAVQVYNEGCPKQIDENPLFGIGYFVPPSHDSTLARAYFENAACLMAEKLTTETQMGPTLVILVYSGDVTGRAQYVYCVTEPVNETQSSDWY
jgi:hypothetical protein